MYCKDNLLNFFCHYQIEIQKYLPDFRIKIDHHLFEIMDLFLWMKNEEGGICIGLLRIKKCLDWNGNKTTESIIRARIKTLKKIGIVRIKPSDLSDPMSRSVITIHEEIIDILENNSPAKYKKKIAVWLSYWASPDFAAFYEGR